ncbi:YecH family metal-binding protein [Shewanella sp. GutDb-MelDb]|uniref:YecH family metal-binding protein n=1 Tax=Shewanella sp. GutDb-MelDb TaxID=2058316 RepID=UPI000C7A2F19|nr:YecH family metal-binding protein [Shewanella sp. GutDb-MelDb]PKG59267.1 metal-binding protein [Shewanella sp. GutDb-MelDb]
MSDSIHGHKVMELMLEHEEPLSREALKALMQGTFGAGARYHTCSAEEMDAEALIDFLEKKGKFIHSETGIATAADRICNH